MFKNLELCPFDIGPKLLYHYTNADSLFKILESMQFKLSSFRTLNDLNESEANFPIQDLYMEVTIQDFIVDNCRVASFSKDYIKNSKLVHWGLNHPRMWAQYSGNNSGVCIVLNENEILKRNADLFESRFLKMEDVVYQGFIFSGKVEKSKIPAEILKRNYKKLFFKKHNDWADERERRLFLIGNFDFIDIQHCIEYVCLGCKFSQDNYQNLINILFTNHNKGFQNIIPHEIVIQTNSGGRISPSDNAPKIMELIRERNLINNQYVEFLKSSGYSI